MNRHLTGAVRLFVLRTTGLVAALALLLSGADAWAQRMSFLHTPPPSAQAGEDLALVGTIYGAGEDLARARCRYRQRGASWKQVELGLEYGDVYRAVIPGRDVLPPSIEYYCIAFDFFGAQTELYGSPSAPRRVKVTGDYAPTAEVTETSGSDATVPADGDEKLRSREPEVRKDEAVTARPAPTPKESKAEELELFGTEDVVTLATRQAQSVTDAPAIATGVPEDQMRALGLRTLPDVAKTVPGFETSRDVQGFYRIAARGIRDDGALLVLYDGHKLNSPYDARPLLNIPVENAERVEAIRGPGSALYGTGAFLGVINIASKRRETVEVAVSGGSFGTVDGHLSIGHRLTPDLIVFADADVLRTDGYQRSIRTDSISGALEQSGLKDPDDHAGITNDSNLFLNIGTELRYGNVANGQSRVALRYLREDRGALAGLFDAVGPDSRLTWDVILADVIHERAIPFGTLTGRLYFDHQIADRHFQIAPANFPLTPTVTAPNGLFERTHFSAQTFGAEGNVDMTLFQSHKLSLGVSASLERLPSYSYEVNYTQSTVFDRMQRPEGLEWPQDRPEFNQRMIFGAYAQDVWRIFESLSLTLGVRADVTQLPRTEGAGNSLTVVGTQFVPSINPRLGVVFSPTDGLNLKLLYGRAFRAPTMQELAEKTPNTDFASGRFEGNPALRPSTIDTVEAGVETVTAVRDNKLRLRGNGFFNHFSDPITAIDTSGNIIPMSNRPLGVRVFGVEAELRFEVSSRAYTFMNYSWFRAQDLAAPEGFQLLTDVPQYRVNWALVLPLGRYFDFSVLTQLGAERRNNGRSKLETMRTFKIPAYALVGAQVRTQTLWDHVDFALTAQNVFDYDLKDDVPRPDRMRELLPREGLGAYLTARARF